MNSQFEKKNSKFQLNNKKIFKEKATSMAIQTL